MSASNRTTSLNAFLHVSHEELHIQWRIDNWQKQLFHQQLYLLIMSYNPFGWEVLSERRNMRTEDLQIFLNPLPFFFASSISLLLPINNLLCVFAAAIRWCNQQSSMILRVSREIQHKFPNSFYVHAGIESTPIPLASSLTAPQTSPQSASICSKPTSLGFSRAAVCILLNACAMWCHC